MVLGWHTGVMATQTRDVVCQLVIVVSGSDRIVLPNLVLTLKQFTVCVVASSAK